MNNDEMKFGRSSETPIWVQWFGKLMAIWMLSGLHGMAVAHLDLTQPSQPVTLYSNQLMSIGWDVYISHGAGLIDIAYSTDGGNSYSPIIEGLPYSGPQDRYGDYDWVVPELASTDGRIRVTYAPFGDGVFYNGLYPDEVDPVITFRTVEASELVLEEGVNGFEGTRDNTIFEGAATENNSFGGGEFIFAGVTASSLKRRGLVAFDLAPIPMGAVVLSASLSLTVSRTNAGATSMSLSRLTRDWGEGSAGGGGGGGGAGVAAQPGDATWLAAMHPSQPWNLPGAEEDYTVPASATTVVGGTGSPANWESAALTQDVQQWIDRTVANHGWIVIGDESTTSTTKQFYSSESTEATHSQRPHLEIKYYLEPKAAISEPARNWNAYP